MIGNIYSNIRMSQEDRILLHLIHNGKISNKECNEIYGFRHLPSVIRYLRKRGIKITSEPKNGENRFGQAAYWVDYTLAPINEQTEKVKKELKQLKDSIGGIKHACNR